MRRKRSEGEIKCINVGGAEPRGKVLESSAGLTGDVFVGRSASYQTRRLSIPVQNYLLIPDRGSLLAPPVRRSPAASQPCSPAAGAEVRRCK